MDNQANTSNQFQGAQNDTLDTFDFDSLPSDLKVVYQQIVEMRNTKEKFIENTENYEKTLKNQRQLYMDAQAKKKKLETEVAKNRCELEHGKIQNAAIKKQLENIRAVVEKTGKHCVSINDLIEQSAQNKNKLIKENGNLKHQTEKHLESLRARLQCKKNKAAIRKETIAAQHKKHNENLKENEQEYLKKAETVKSAEETLQSLKRLFEKQTLINQDHLNKIAEAKNENQQLECLLRDQINRFDELTKKISEKEQEFDLQKNEILQSSDMVDEEFVKCAERRETLEKAIKSQQEYNKNYLENVTAKEKQIEGLHVTIIQRATNNEIKKIQAEKDETTLKDEIASETATLNDIEKTFIENQEILKQTEEDIITITNRKYENMMGIEGMEVTVTNLQNKHSIQCEQITVAKKGLTSILSKIEEAKNEIHEWCLKTEALEHTTCLITKKTALLHAIIAETSEFQKKAEDTRIMVVQEMDSIKKNFDLNTHRETAEFREKQTRLQNAIDATKKELQKVKYLQGSTEDTLEKLMAECEATADKIKYLEEQKPSLLQSAPVKLSASELLPTRTTKRQAFDEFSCSSEEGTVLHSAQVSALKREQERRRQLRAQQKRSKKNN